MIEMDSSDLIESTVTSTRVRLARNLFSYPFPDKLDEKRAREIIRVVGYELNRLDTFTEYDIGKIEPDEADLSSRKAPHQSRPHSPQEHFRRVHYFRRGDLGDDKRGGSFARTIYPPRAISIRRTSALAASTTASAAPSASLTTKNWAISRRVRAISARGCALR